MNPDALAYLGCRKTVSAPLLKSKQTQCQGQEDDTTIPRPRHPSSPEGSPTQALDPSACLDPSVRARPDQNAINRGRGQEARGQDGASFPTRFAVLQVGPHKIASRAGHRSPLLPQWSVFLMELVLPS